MALPRSCDRRVPQESRGLVDVERMTEAGHGCARAGSRKESPPDDFSLVFHDDQGSSTLRAFQRCLEIPWNQSMSRPGNPWDNALAESAIQALKRELVNGKELQDEEEAKQDVFKYIELYNRQRMHSSMRITCPCDPRAECCLKKLIFRQET